MTRLVHTVVLLTVAWAGVLASGVLAEGKRAGLEQHFMSTAQMTPAIESLEPKAGPAGTQVTIKGANLAGATRVLFSPEREAPFTIVSDTVIQATVPDGAQSGPVQVQTATGTGKSRDIFSVAPN